MNAPVSRAEFFHILYGSMPADSYTARDSVSDNAIPDVKTGDAYAAEIYAFYRAGILTGSDQSGTFRPASSIQRCEVAAILVRMFTEAERVSITLN
ncbi:MAG: S-layer homology domain-containing protein [Oscillospiraceae bacterium]|nr:S-layer homology domain-containing protein [Oscillospiraceae bacterium]